MLAHFLRAFAPLLALLILAVPVRAEEESGEPEPPTEVAADVDAEVAADDAAATGRFTLTLVFTPSENLGRVYRIELRVMAHGREVLALDHSPEPPTTQWKKGQVVRYAVDVPVPVAEELSPGTEMRVYVGFFDPAIEKTVQAATEKAMLFARVPVARLEVPKLGPVDAADALDAILAKAAELASAGRKPDAWSTLELGIRRATEDSTKKRLRDALMALGDFPPRPIGIVERQIVQRRIQAERKRYLREVAGRYRDQKKLFAALRILEAIGGSLAEQSEQAVIGALSEAKRTQVAVDDIQREIMRPSDDDRAAAKQAVEKHGYDKALLGTARDWIARGDFGAAKVLLFDISTGNTKDIRFAAREMLDALEADWLQATPPEEQALVDEAVGHPAFDRLDVVPTHNFLYIGPKVLVNNMPAKSRLRFDLAYVFLTDLFGRMPNPGGDRITVFFKELWNFGGGQGGGKKIDIGKADPRRKGYRVDTGLMYHELTHCIDDTTPTLHGWREGLANMGATYAFDALGQDAGRLGAFRTNLLQFENDYVNRDLPYWRIPQYGPSAGFFLHFVANHSKTSAGYDWKPYRTFFREYRAAPIRDGREPYVARAFGYYLVRAFGEPAFDDLLRFRFPLVESDRQALALELEAFVEGRLELDALATAMGAFPNSPVPRDVLQARMLSEANGGSREKTRAISRDKLGIIHDWWVIGPFGSRGADPRCCVFPPQNEIDLAGEYPSESNVCRWRRAGDTGLVTIDPTGWVGIHFNYQDDTADYALTHVTVPEATDAFVHVRTDDDFQLFVNDRLVNDYVNRGGNGSKGPYWRGPFARVPDMQRLATRLEKGRNKILLKVKNRGGDAGFILAVSRLDGRPIEGLVADLEPAAPKSDTVVKKSAWSTKAKQSFKRKSLSKFVVAVGKLKVTNALMFGESKDKGVAWRKYTVRPGFPKDSPSNLFWLKSKITDKIESFRLTLDLVPDKQKAPKLVVTFQGEGGGDGLSGWNLIVHPKGKGKVAARLERYDHVFYETMPVAHPKTEVMPLVLTLVDGRLTVTLGETVLMENVPIIPIPGRHRIGVSTFGPSLKFARFKLESLKK